MFHLGNPADTAAVVKKWAANGSQLHLVQQDSGAAPWTVALAGAETLLLEASGLSMSELETVARDANETYGTLLTAITFLVDDMLRQCGARMPDPALRRRMPRKR